MDDARIEDLRAMHFVAESKAYPFCYECDQAWPCGTAYLIAALEASRAECARLRQLLEGRQRYIHAEIHVDEQNVPLGYWKDCRRATCFDTAAALNGAADATVGEP